MDESSGISTLEFFIPGEPRGKGRPRAARRGKHIALYTDDKTAAYEGLVALCANQAMKGRPLIKQAMRLTVDVRLPVRQSWSKRKQADALSGTLPAITKPDLDNVVKAVKDGCNGVVWLDDALVVRYGPDTGKRYAAQPGVRVVVEVLA